MVKQNVLVNTLTIQAGGGIQVAVNFIINTLSCTKYKYYYLLSLPIYNELQDIGSLPSDYRVARHTSAIKFFHNYVLIYRVFIALKPDIVFTIFGPAYFFTGSTPHLCGYAVPWDFVSDELHILKLSPLSNIKNKLFSAFRRAILDRNSFYWVETQDFKIKFKNYMKFRNTHVFVVPNTINPTLRLDSSPDEMTNLSRKSNYFDNGDKYNVLLLSAPYLHKNIDIIPYIANILKNSPFSTKIKFSVSLSRRSTNKTEQRFWSLVDSFNCNSLIDELGRIPLSSLPSVYNSVDLVFCPSVLEVFSATPLEAFHFGKPVLASNLSFNSNLFGNSLYYFNPCSPISAYYALVSIYQNRFLQDLLIQRGKIFLASHPSETIVFDMHMQNIAQCLDSVST